MQIGSKEHSKITVVYPVFTGKGARLIPSVPPYGQMLWSPFTRTVILAECSIGRQMEPVERMKGKYTEFSAVYIQEGLKTITHQFEVGYRGYIGTSILKSNKL